MLEAKTVDKNIELNIFLISNDCFFIEFYLFWRINCIELI